VKVTSYRHFQRNIYPPIACLNKLPSWVVK